jgi:presenilin-like A22 family membrane protease
MAEITTEFWDWSPIRPRRFTLVDIMVIVAMVAFLSAGIAAAWHSDLREERKELITLLALICPVLCASLWYLSGIDVRRWRLLDGLISLVIILMTVADALAVLTIGYFHPPGAGFVCLTLSALIVYLASWVR